jgi:hypothetical protein
MSTTVIKPVAFIVAAGALIGAGIDAGSVTLTRLSIEDNVQQAGQAGATAVEGMPVSQRAATIALAAAEAEARKTGLKVRTKNFRLHQDGTVELTGTRIAPTLLLEHLEPFRHYTKVRATERVDARPFT